MIKEVVEHLLGVGAKTAAPVTLHETATDKTIFVGGEITELSKGIDPRRHQVDSLRELMSFVDDFIGRHDDPSVVVWYDADQIVVVLDDDGHRVDRLCLALDPSDSWVVISNLFKSRPSFDLKGFVRLLRIDLAACLDPAVLLNRVRKVRFENGQTVSADLQRNRESMGREITAAVSADSELPEEVVLTVNPLKPGIMPAARDTPYGIRCAVEIDPSMGTFKLTPLPDEVERVSVLVLADIEAELEAGLPGVRRYRGRP